MEWVGKSTEEQRVVMLSRVSPIHRSREELSGAPVYQRSSKPPCPPAPGDGSTPGIRGSWTKVLLTSPGPRSAPQAATPRAPATFPQEEPTPWPGTLSPSWGWFDPAQGDGFPWRWG